MVQLTLACVSKKLTEDVIDACYKVKTNSQDSVKSIIVTRAAPAGEGLIGAVYRIQVKGSQHETTFVAKGLINDPLLRKTLRCSRYFQREVYFFSSVLPLLKEVQKSTGATENIQDSVPVCYCYYCDGDNDFILMEDLAVNFNPISENPSEFETDASLKALAHLHAVSMTLRSKRPEEFSKIKNNLYEVYYNDDNREWYAQYLQNAIEIDIKALREFENENSIYYKKFVELVDRGVYAQLMDLVTSSGNHPTINHGDAWLPNFLCSKERAVAIDFQLLRCTSLVTDLTYILMLCTGFCTNKQKFMEVVGVYYKYLEYYLTDMGMDPSQVYSWENLQEELAKYGKFGILAALTSIPLLASERCDVQLSFQEKFLGVERIPLELLWPLHPMQGIKEKMALVTAVRVSVDVGLI